MTPTENEMTPEGAVAPNRSGVASGTIPEAVSSTTGVSVRYAPVPKGEWFVFRASYNRELKAADFILNEGIYAYVPQQYVWKEKDGKPKKELKSLISCKFFVYTDAKTAQKMAKDTPELSYLNFDYDHTRQNPDGTNPPLRVPQREMEQFLRVCQTHSEHLLWMNPEEMNLKLNDPVLVTDGPFKGVEGYFVRAKKQNRVAIQIENLGCLVTAYIPTAFIRPL